MVSLWKKELQKSNEKNQFKLINFDIKISETLQHFNNFLKSLGKIDHVTVSMTTEENTSIFNLKLKDNLRDIVISS